MVGNILKQKGETIAVAESCTGGSLGAMLTDIEGSSAYFMGGVIAYSNEVKMKLLGVSEDVLTKEGAVSAIVAEQMATGVIKRLGTDWGIGITGIAGPGGGTDTKPVGLVYIGIASAKGEVFSYGDTYGTNRGRYLVRYLSACNALDRFRRML